VTDLSPQQSEALDAAHALADAGMPIFAAYRNNAETGGEFLLPNSWQWTAPKKASHNWIDRWKPGMALCGVTGVALDVLDIDPRNGGRDGFHEIAQALDWDRTGAGPRPYAIAETPSQGEHIFIGRTRIAKTSKAGKGVDLQAGLNDGEGRGFVYLAPTERVSKFGPRQGEMVAYRWTMVPGGLDRLGQEDPGLIALAEYVQSRRGGKRTGPWKSGDIVTFKDMTPLAPDDADAFADYAADWTWAEADKLIDQQCQAVEDAKEGEVNSTLGGAARVLGRFVAGGWLTTDEAAARLMDALESGGVHSDAWNLANRKTWTAATVIGAGLANGADEPWTVESPTSSEQSHSAVPSQKGVPAAGVGVTPVAGHSAPAGPGSSPSPGVAPRLEISGAADSAYWLQDTLGGGPLSGFFTREGRVVHTPLVSDLGYVAPRLDVDENGPAQIQAVSSGTLAAKIQYAYACFKTIKGKDGKPDTVAHALFPLQAAQRAVDAPEAMARLRSPAGITLTPMVRADGSILAIPGYDPASRYLFLPERGVKVAPVPEQPTDAEVDQAVSLLDTMLAGFPWASKDDKVNFLGLLLTPMLRLVTPPTYKMFGIGAHQPGSGKTLLADIATALHGGVLRSEVPEDEPEWRKQTTSILSQTSAPIVHIDNVTGVLKSSTLAGLLTAGQATSDRELGSNRIITTINDRVWVVTGNNLSLSGDLVRRTILIMIDPNMANPETREFEIPDLKGWVAAHRNELLWALLVMIRAWVAAGKPETSRPQSDSFARWEATVAGILSACRIDGDFDRESGKLAAAGGDDDDAASVLAHLRDRFVDREFTVNDALEAWAAIESTDVADFVIEGRDAARDWLPSVVLDKLGRSEAAGRKSFGYWLRNRLGRWVTDADGRSLVIRAVGRNRVAALWRIEQA
jgi:hypothetical protein